MTPTAELAVLRLGRTPYLEGVALQERLVARRLAGEGPEVLVVLEHPPVITLGHRGNRDCLLVSEEHLGTIGVELHRSSRGGDATYHGPGQVVAYAIVDLRARGLRVGELIDILEETMIRAAAAQGVAAARIEGKPGVFVGSDKLGAVGLHVARGVTCHGLALNVEPDVSHFELIVPCGLRDNGVTTLSAAAGRSVDQRVVEEDIVMRLASLMDLALVAYEGPEETP